MRGAWMVVALGCGEIAPVDVPHTYQVAFEEQDSQLDVWKSSTSSITQTPGMEGEPHFTHDGSLVVVGPKLMDLNALTFVPKNAKSHDVVLPIGVREFGVRSDGKRLALAAVDATLRTFDLDGTLSASIASGVWWVGYAPDDVTLVLARSDGVTNRITTMKDDGTDEAVLVDAPEQVSAPAFSFDGSQVVFMLGCCDIDIIDRTSRVMRTLVTVPDGAWSPQLTPDGASVVFIERAANAPAFSAYALARADVATASIDVLVADMHLLKLESTNPGTSVSVAAE